MRTARWFDPETPSEGVIHVRRSSAIVAAVAAAAILGIAATSATAAEPPSLADDVAARLGITPDKLRMAFKEWWWPMDSQYQRDLPTMVAVGEPLGWASGRRD